MSETAPPLICIVGPTAGGKTALALALAAQHPVEVISMDSAQVYRQMDIGTAKPDASERQAVPHHLIDILDPAQNYSAAQFARDARQLIGEIAARGRTPMLVGGTFLYLRALLEGLSEMPPADPVLRRELAEDAEREGWPALHARLAQLDPDTAAALHPNDAQRIQRALEIVLLTGRGRNAHINASATEPWPGPVLRLAVAPARRAILRERIARRFRHMMDAGFLDEVAALRARDDLHLGLPSMRAVGYRQLWAHLDGEMGLEDAVERGIIASRQYAKRQLTWLRREAELCWLDSDDPESPQAASIKVKRFLCGSAS